jgi:hypothetical protein
MVKGESDDIRSSLSYKLKRILRFRASVVLCSEEYMTTDADLTPSRDHGTFRFADYRSSSPRLCKYRRCETHSRHLRPAR